MEGRKTHEEMENLVPEDFRKMYPGDSRLVTEDGQPVSQALIEYSYTREGRRYLGVEFLNPIPVEAPIPQAPYEDIWETLKRMVVDHMHRAKQEEGEEEFDTEEEANDFETEDGDFDPASPWEEHHEPTDPWPMSSAARQLEQAIAEKRNAGRIAILKDELDALQNGKEWPPKEEVPPPPDTKEPASLTVKNQAGKVVGTVAATPNT